jgi:hypothetical protein
VKPKTATRHKPPDRELATLQRFVKVYCRAHHGSNGSGLCKECHDLLEYAEKRREKCPYDPKPKCKNCITHCFRPEYREKIRKVMRFSGKHFVKRGRIDWMVKYFL